MKIEKISLNKHYNIFNLNKILFNVITKSKNICILNWIIENAKFINYINIKK